MRDNTAKITPGYRFAHPGYGTIVPGGTNTAVGRLLSEAVHKQEAPGALVFGSSVA